MMKLDEIRRALQDRNLSIVSQRTGLHYQTIWRIARGARSDFSYDTISRVSDYLSQKV